VYIKRGKRDSSIFGKEERDQDRVKFNRIRDVAISMYKQEKNIKEDVVLDDEKQDSAPSVNFEEVKKQDSVLVTDEQVKKSNINVSIFNEEAKNKIKDLFKALKDVKGEKFDNVDKEIVKIEAVIKEVAAGFKLDAKSKISDEDKTQIKEQVEEKLSKFIKRGNKGFTSDADRRKFNKLRDFVIPIVKDEVKKNNKDEKISYSDKFSHANSKDSKSKNDKQH
jgi:hypothetical protein